MRGLCVHDKDARCAMCEELRDIAHARGRAAQARDDALIAAVSQQCDSLRDSQPGLEDDAHAARADAKPAEEDVLGIVYPGGSPRACRTDRRRDSRARRCLGHATVINEIDDEFSTCAGGDGTLQLLKKLASDKVADLPDPPFDDAGEAQPEALNH